MDLDEIDPLVHKDVQDVEVGGPNGVDSSNVPIDAMEVEATSAVNDPSNTEVVRQPVKLKHEYYFHIVKAIIAEIKRRERERHLARPEATDALQREANALAEEEDEQGAGIKYQDLVEWYLSSIYDQLETEEDVLAEGDLIKKIIKRMVKKVISIASDRIIRIAY